MADLRTDYLGLKLKCPVVCSPSPLCHHLDKIREMEDHGAGAVVLHSLFEEQIDLESELMDWHLNEAAESYAEALSYFPQASAYHSGPDGYLEHLRKAKESTDIPIIGSLNGVSGGGWTRYGKLMEEAGADALELNIFYLPTALDQDGPSVEQRYIDTVREVCASVSIPVAVKLGPYFSAFAHFATQLEAVGARGLVLFNRFYQPDLDIEALEVKPSLVLSNSEELRQRLLWTAVLYGRIGTDLAITGGVHRHEDVLKSMMAGAQVAMMTSSLLKSGLPYLSVVIAEMETWMNEHDYESVEQMRGSMSQRSVRDPEAFERANYLRVLSSYHDVLPGST